MKIVERKTPTTEQLRIELEKLHGATGRRATAPGDPLPGGRLQSRGVKLLNFTDWDLLNVHRAPRVRRSMQEVIEQGGIGVGASRTGTGTHALHLACERRLAGFVGCEDAILFSSKNQAVLSLVTLLCGERDLVLADEVIQSPVADAAQLVGSEFRSFADPAGLQKALEQSGGYARIFVFIETLSPVTGMAAPLETLIPLCARFGAECLIDDSAALGLLGMCGAGSADLLGPLVPVFCRYAELSRVLPGGGAFVAAERVVIEYLLQRSRTFEIEVAMPPLLCAAILAGLDLVELAAGGRKQLGLMSARLAGMLKSAGCAPLNGGSTPVISFQTRTGARAREIKAGLLQRGIAVDCVTGFRPRSDQGIVRMLPGLAHREEDLDLLGEAVGVVARRSGEVAGKK